MSFDAIPREQNIPVAAADGKAASSTEDLRVCCCTEGVLAAETGCFEVCWGVPPETQLAPATRSTRYIHKSEGVILNTHAHTRSAVVRETLASAESADGATNSNLKSLCFSFAESTVLLLKHGVSHTLAPL